MDEKKDKILLSLEVVDDKSRTQYILCVFLEFKEDEVSEVNSQYRVNTRIGEIKVISKSGRSRIYKFLTMK